MNYSTNFDSLFAELEAFSPELDDADIFVPPLSSSPSVSSSDHSVPPSKILFISQNVMKSNVVTHSLLNISSSKGYPADVILIQEPWFGRIGIDVITGKDIFGCPSHPN
jgi:hypothetical protein